jgi:hypothetical protein
VDVIVNNPALGYAGRNNSITQLPTVSRGFQVDSIVPTSGSVMGGNTLTLTGRGFLPGRPEMHTVLLRELGIEPLTTYDDLLVALGFPAKTVRQPNEEISCTVLTATDDMLTCLVPAHAAPYAPNSYNVTVTLNSIVSSCGPSTSCVYAQDMASTPLLNATVEVVHMDTYGRHRLHITGRHLRPAAPIDSDPFGLKVWVGGIPCTVIEVNDTRSGEQLVTIDTPPLPAGNLKITANVWGLGDALSGAILPMQTAVLSLETSTAVASMAGGAEVSLHGRGFAANCADNTVVLTLTSSVSGLTSVALTVSNYLSCDPNTLVFLTPSLVPLFPAGLHRTGSLSWSVNHVVVAVHGANNSTLPTSNALAYTSLATPVAVVNATSGYHNSILKAAVSTGMDIPVENVTITIGGKACAIVHGLDSTHSEGVSGSTFRQTHTRYCRVPELVASTTPYPVLVRVDPLGHALQNTTAPMALPTFTSLFRADHLQHPLNSSVRGGIDLTIRGAGFSNAVTVTVCEQACTPTGPPSSYDTLRCTLPERYTTSVVSDIKFRGIDVDRIVPVTGTYVSSLNDPTSALLANAHDTDYATYFEHWSTTCSVGIKLPTGYKAQPYRMRFYPRFKYSTNVRNFVFEGSMDGGTTYTTIAASSSAHEGWNFVNAPADKALLWYNAFRYRAVDTTAFYSRCMLAEVEFLGTVGATQSVCPITVSSPTTASSAVIGSVNYGDMTHFTPLITGLFPNNGSALGGTVVTITGEHLDTFASVDNHHAVTVQLSGVTCTVQSSSATQIVCVTSPRKPEDVERSSVVVTIPGRGVAVVGDEVAFLYIDRWSALTSWKNQDLPVEGDFVWIPDGQVILLDVHTPILTFLLVEGDLYFDRARDVSLDSYYIFVFGGYFEVGTEDHPYEKSAVITLHGGRYSTIEIPFVGSKVLAVAARGLPRAEHMTGQHMPGRDQGQLEVHGSKRLRTWTKLDATANAGDHWLLTSERVDFKRGEVVIVTGSERPGTTMDGSGDDFSLYGMEEMTVDSVSSDGFNVSFTAPLRFTHRSEIVTIEGRVIDMRVEIGLLTRNVVIQGDNDTSTGELFGVHTIAFMSGIYHMENAEIRRCGQAFNFGRYCTHSHMAGDMRSSYVKANSIHHSFQRAVTTHDTRNWEVS